MTRRALGVMIALVGAVWVVQGFGIVGTGSFMDRDPLWGFLGVFAVLSGLGLAILRFGR